MPSIWRGRRAGRLQHRVQAQAVAVAEHRVEHLQVHVRRRDEEQVDDDEAQHVLLDGLRDEVAAGQRAAAERAAAVELGEQLLLLGPAVEQPLREAGLVFGDLWGRR